MPAHPKLYTFAVHIDGSENPVISRTISISANATFHQLHLAIQYAFRWTSSHLHTFAVEQCACNDNGAFSPSVRLAPIVPQDLFDEDEGWSNMAVIDEIKPRLSHLWNPASKSTLQSKLRGQSTSPIVEYEYDPFCSLGIHLFLLTVPYRAAGLTTLSC